MATSRPTNVATNLVGEFDFVATRIHQLFDTLIAQLIERRAALLLKLSQLREDYTAKETTRRAAILKIETAQQQQMQELSLKENINIPVHQQTNEAYKQALKRLETPTKFLCPYFKCPTVHKLESLIAEFGEVVAWEVPDYTLKKEPVLTAGKYGTSPKELKGRGLAIDESNKRIYTADYGSSRILMVSFEGDFIERFGQNKLSRPWGIALTDEHIFVTDTALHALFQFQKNSFQLINRTGTKGRTDGQFNLPAGLCIDYSGDVFVADSYNNRVCVFSKELQFVSSLGAGQLKYPRDVKLTPDCLVVVLDRSPKCVHFFTRNGHLLSSCVSREVGPDCLVCRLCSFFSPSFFSPSFFCLDTAGNIIISEYDSHSIRIMARTDQLKHTVGRKGIGRGELVHPFGITVSNTGTIIVVSDNDDFTIQCF